MREPVIRRLLAALVALLGGVVVFGWIVGAAPVVRLMPDFAAMTFVTALCFLLTGAALLAPELWPVRGQAIQTRIGYAVVVLATAMIAEHLGDVDLGIDLLSLHAPLDPDNPHPGRMAFNTALALVLIGTVLAVMRNVRGAAGISLLTVLVLGATAIGATGLVGYVLGVEFIYAWFGYSSMALHTAIGLTVAGGALALATRALPWYRERIAANPAEHIGMVGAAWLISIALIAGITGFVVMQQRAEESLGDTLAVALHNRIQLFDSLITLRAGNTTLIATRPAMIMHLRTLASAPDDARARAAVAEVAASFLPGGFSAVAIYDQRGAEVSQRGVFALEPTLALPLNASHDAELLWQDGFILRTRAQLSDVSGVVGTALAEQRLDILTQTIDDVAGLGSTGDAGICGRQSQLIHCFPQRLRPEGFTVPVQQGSKPLPISLAFEGKTGVVRSIDYRGKQVIAAYGPIGSLGLGMSLKMDAAEIYAPLRERLELFVPLLLALVITGAMVLRMQLRPLVSELLKSREALRERTVELERTNADLERALHAKDRFLATMSHELRTPLNAILGFTGTLLMRLPGTLTNTQEQQLRTVQTAGKHLLSLINDLLDLARIESGKVVMKRETVECQEVLNELVTALRPLAERKGLRLDCRFGTVMTPLCTDRRALLQILMNLTNNAIKYTSSGSVAIECNQRADGGRVATDITIIDTGVGIKQEEQEQLFNAFARVGDPRAHQEGTGLGLYYSRKLAELLGARITFTSEFGSGSRFTLTL